MAGLSTDERLLPGDDILFGFLYPAKPDKPRLWIEDIPLVELVAEGRIPVFAASPGVLPSAVREQQLTEVIGLWAIIDPPEDTERAERARSRYLALPPELRKVALAQLTQFRHACDVTFPRLRITYEDADHKWIWQLTNIRSGGMRLAVWPD